MVSVKGYEITLPKVKDSHSRRAEKSKYNIITTLRGIGLTEDDVDIDIPKIPVKKEAAKVSWWYNDEHLFFSYKGGNYAENIAVIAKVLALEIQQVINRTKSINDFIATFREDPEVEEQRKEARDYLGVDEDASLDEINKAYKKIAKAAHPDMPSGDTKIFKEVNIAHKLLKRELE